MWSNMGNDKMLIIIMFGYKTDILDVNTPTLKGELKELCSLWHKNIIIENNVMLRQPLNFQNKSNLK